MDFMALANTKLAASLGQGFGEALGGPKGPTVSGGGAMDARSFMDGSGWTVSTGSSKAQGGDREDAGPTWDPSTAAPQAVPAAQAGISTGTLLALVVMMALLWKRKQ